jgi:hypothetical protein
MGNTTNLPPPSQPALGQWRKVIRSGLQPYLLPELIEMIFRYFGGVPKTGIERFRSSLCFEISTHVLDPVFCV